MMFSAISSTISRFVYTVEDGRDEGLWSCIRNHCVLAFLTSISWIMPQRSILILLLNTQLLYTGLDSLVVQSLLNRVKVRVEENYL